MQYNSVGHKAALNVQNARNDNEILIGWIIYLDYKTQLTLKWKHVSFAKLSSSTSLDHSYILPRC